MSDLELFLIWLSQFGFEDKTLAALVELFDDEPTIEKMEHAKGLERIVGEEMAGVLRKQAMRINVRAFFQNLVDARICIAVKGSTHYPDRYVDCPDSPRFLYCKGDLSLFNRPSLAVVGTREPSNYGRIVTERIVGALAKEGIVIVSGLAYGVDSIAHRKAIDVGGGTIAVIAAGFSHIYPPQHESLAAEIAQKGLLVSEYPPSTPVYKYAFPRRNRIIAGISDATLVVEGGMKSGTRHTKEYALEYGREIFAVPGPINSEKSDLPNYLIKTGAHAVTCPEDILEVLNITQPKAWHKPLQDKTNVETKSQMQGILTEEEQKLYDAIGSGEVSTLELEEKTGFGAQILNTYLTMLEVRGIIKRLPGGLYARQ